MGLACVSLDLPTRTYEPILLVEGVTIEAVSINARNYNPSNIPGMQNKRQMCSRGQVRGLL